MILQSLYDLYGRLSEDPANGLPKPGYSLQNITFCVVLKPDGTIVEIQDARQEERQIGRNGREKKTLRPITIVVPGQTKPSGQGINPCTLWDNLTYLCGYAQPDKKAEKAEKNRIRAPRCFEGSRQHHVSLFTDVTDRSILAVRKYFERYQPDQILPFIENLPVDARVGNGVFQITGQTSYAHSGYHPIESIRGNSDEGDDVANGQCLITGEILPIARLHEPKIKTFDPKGSLLVSFNERAYESFAKEDSKKTGQGRNSPVSETAAFAYCNALNFLLSSKSRRFRIGDATTVFWTDQPTPAEELLPWLMSGLPDAEDSQAKARLNKILDKISQGTLAADDLGSAETRYFILGLSPNASRLSVRFWHTGTIDELVANLKLHFDHLRIVRQWDETNSKKPEPLAPTAYQLLRQTSRDADGIPPLLGGPLMRSILLGTRYPDSLINGVMNRIRVVEKKPKGEGSLDNVSYLRAAILKAWLIRNHKQTITTMLDETNTNPGYRLGRLFAVLEKTQQDALPGINATIRERFYSSASATPRAVFGRLLRMYPNHLSKAQSEWAGKIGTEKAIKRKNGREILCQEILSSVSDFPAHLNLQNQAQFALGYYHQRKDFFTKKETTEPTPSA
ncbi:MAG: type I-C CRISPR-associated protein Cas8c/Csd1 [Akkermansiaceae bacterium]|nr:type I-C CRISPR-associated protein Cas8c/Csd1 [Akkermansiaceae bacterium]